MNGVKRDRKAKFMAEDQGLKLSYASHACKAASRWRGDILNKLGYDGGLARGWETAAT